MEKAKAAVGNFMSRRRHRAGHHDTTVHETVAPAVTQETVKNTRVEETQTAIDREIHQDHYHTSVQPIKDREMLPEQHSHRMVGVEERHHKHGDEAAVRARLEQERRQFRDERRETAERVHETSAPVVAGEHVHHHVHETIQPVIQKETIQPSVVHTTVPIHEVHHREAKHHAASALPAVSMSEFRAQGGSLGGRAERVDGFEGEPKPVASTLGAGGAAAALTGAGTGHHGATGTNGTVTGTGHHGTTGTTGTGVSGAGPHNSRLANEADPRVDSDRDGRSGLGRNGNVANSTGFGTGSRTGAGVNGPANGVNGVGTGNYGSSTAGPHNSNIANKADPRVDSDRDGRSGLGNSAGGVHTNAVGSSTAGPHNSNIANKADPRVDSDLDGRSGVGRTTGVGATSGAGPHNSKLENKIDPRVDSNRDGVAGVGK